MNETIKIERHKSYKYVVNYPTGNGTNRKFTWEAPRTNKPTSHLVPLEVYHWIAENTLTFDRGELLVSRTQENKEEVEQAIVGIDEYKANGKTNDEIVELLTKSGLPKLKKELELITEKSSKQHVYDVFNGIKDTLVGSKIELVEKWYISKSDKE